MNRPRVYMCPLILSPPPSPLYTSGLSQSTGFGFPASCIELALVIYDHMVIHKFQCYVWLLNCVIKAQKKKKKLIEREKKEMKKEKRKREKERGSCSQGVHDLMEDKKR